MDFRTFTHQDVKCPKFKILVHITYHHALIDNQDKIIRVLCPIVEGEHPKFRCDGFECNSPRVPCYVISSTD